MISNIQAFESLKVLSSFFDEKKLLCMTSDRELNISKLNF